MAPVHDTDLEKERWTKNEWRYIELWEKVERRLKKRKRLLVLITVVIVVMISSVPVILDRSVKWEGLKILRQVGQEINALKKEAALTRRSFHLKLLSGPALGMQIHILNRCEDQNLGSPARTKPLGQMDQEAKFMFLSSEQGAQNQLPGVVDEVCIDYLSGVSFKGSSHPSNESLAFVISPVKDLTEQRLDRVSILMVRGKNGSISFN